MHNTIQSIVDGITFPIRAVTLFEHDRLGLSSLATERFSYVAREVKGYCLDVGCGRHNRFVSELLQGNGKGIDVFAYEGLSKDQIVEDMSHFPFGDAMFDSVTFIANLNHIPRSLRDAEMNEAYRCLKPGGNIVVTMGHPLAEIIVHKVVWLYDKVFRTNVDMDSERGMHEEEAYYLLNSEIHDLLGRAGFMNIYKKRFWTQWGLNQLYIGWKQ